MPVTVKEDWETEPLVRNQAGGSKGFVFNVHGAASEFEAWAALRDFTPPIYLGLVRSEISAAQTGPLLFKGAVRYSTTGAGGGGADSGGTAVGATPPVAHAAPPNATDALAAGYEFNWVAEMRHRTQSLDTLYRRAVGDALNVIGTAPNYERAVGIARSGGNIRVIGYDAPEPTSTWTRTVPVNPMTLEYRNTIRDLVGRKNDAEFYHSEAGEVVLWGVSGRCVEGFLYTLTFTFHERPNVTNLILKDDPAAPGNPNAADALVVPAASGWDHIWVEYEEEVVVGELLNRPKYAYVEQIIEDGDFSELRIGT